MISSSNAHPRGGLGQVFELQHALFELVRFPVANRDQRIGTTNAVPCLDVKLPATLADRVPALTERIHAALPENLVVLMVPSCSVLTSMKTHSDARGFGDDAATAVPGARC